MNQYLVVGVVFLVVIALLATNKKLVETLKNIYKIEELRKRVIYTIGLLLVYHAHLCEAVLFLQAEHKDSPAILIGKRRDRII